MSGYSFRQCPNVDFGSAKHFTTVTSQAFNLAREKIDFSSNISTTASKVYRRTRGVRATSTRFGNGLGFQNDCFCHFQIQRPFLAFLLYSTTDLSGSKPPSISLQNCFSVFGYCLHRVISKTFSDYRVFKSLPSTTFTSCFLYFVFSTDLPDLQESTHLYPRVCIKESFVTLLRMLRVSNKFCFCFRFSNAHFNRIFTAFCCVSISSGAKVPIWWAPWKLYRQ